MKSIAIRLLGICLCTLFATAVWAQDAGQILGVVSDSSGAVVPRVTVTAIEVGTGLSRATTTGDNGEYVLPSLRPTNYDITAELTGFRMYRRSGVALLANQSLTVNIALEVGTVSDTLEVAGSAVQVDTSTSTLNTVVDQSRLVELPMNGRDAARLTTLVPGVVIITVSIETTKQIPGALRLSANGSRQTQTAYFLDGVVNTDFLYQENQTFPFPDALQEFSIQTSNYSAAYGNNAGGLVNVVTRSGTSKLHGGVFEFVRNGALNARNTFAARADFLKRNQFGAYGGGPMRLPFSGPNRTFFFLGWQGTRTRNTALGNTGFAPTADEELGNFTNCGGPCNKPIKDPLTGLPFPGNQIPISRFDTASVNVSRLFPAASGTGLVVFGTHQTDNLDQGVARVDHQLTEKDRLTFRYFTDDLRHAPVYDPSNLLSYQTAVTLGSGIHTTNMALGWVRTVSPRLLNDFHLGYNRVVARRAPPSGVPTMEQLGVRLPYDSTIPAIHSISVSGFFTVGDNPAASFIRNGFELNDHITWVNGGHTLQFGGEAQHFRLTDDNQYGRPGLYTFSGDATGNAMADFFLGSLRQFRQLTGEYADKRILYPALFIQDDWKVTKRLTLNLGVRYEPDPPWNEQKGRFDNFSIQNFLAGVHSQVFTNAGPGLLFRGDPGVPSAMGQNGDYKDVSGRLGFAWDVFGDGKTSVRGGAGSFYNQHYWAQYGLGASQAWPWGQTVQITSPKGPFSNPYLGLDTYFNYLQLSNSGVPGPNTAFFAPTTISLLSQNRITPVLYNWNLTLEREVFPGWVARAAYVGSTGNHLFNSVELNPSVYIPGSTLGTDARRLLAPYYSNVTYTGDDRISHFQSLQTSMTKRLSKGFTVLANYTFSKSLDNADRNSGLNGGGFGNYQVAPLYLPGVNDSMTYGPSDFDHRHRFVMSYVWELPKLPTSNSFLRQILNGWEWTGIGQFQTGGPLLITSGLDNSKTGIGHDRAQLTGVSPTPPAGSDPRVWFNPAAYTVNPVGTFGNYGIGQLYGPHLFSWDMGMFKNTKIKELWTVQFRAEFFNIFNHVNYNNPNTSVTGAGFGTITSTQPNAGDPRIIQFGLKILF